MSQRNQIRVGATITVFGLVLLVGNLLQVNLWNYLWPIILIGLGAWLILRPAARQRQQHQRILLLGDIRRRGAWPVREEDIWAFIGDIDLDFTHAEIPEGETTLQLQGFVGSVDITVPENLGLKVKSTAVVTDTHILDKKADYFLVPFEYTSKNYDSAAKTVRLDLLHFVTDLRLREIGYEHHALQRN